MRTRLAVLTLSLLLGLGACGGGDTHESLSKQAMSEMEQFVTIVEGITDEASANAAKPKLDALVTRMKDLKARVDKLGERSAEQKAALKKQAEPQWNALGARMGAALTKLQGKPEVLAALTEAMKGLQDMDK